MEGSEFVKKVAILEIWVNETLEDAAECVNEVICSANEHYFISDGSVKIVRKELKDN